MISLLTTCIPHISRLCCSSGHVGSVRIINTLDLLEKTPCTPFVPCFCSLVSTMVSSQGVLQVNLCLFESKTI